MFDFSTLFQSWQGPLVSLTVGVILSWIAKHFLVDQPKAVSMVVQIMEALEGTIKKLLGDKWAPVYDALLKAGQAAMDGNVTLDEAKAIAITTFDTAIKITGVQLDTQQRTILLGILDFVVSALVQNKPASKVAMRSVRMSLKARNII